MYLDLSAYWLDLAPCSHSLDSGDSLDLPVGRHGTAATLASG